MRRSTKIAIAVAAVVVAIPFILLLAGEVIVNSTALKPEIEKIVSAILEMDFKIHGRIDIRLLPLISLAANDLTVRIKAGQIASADRIIIDPRLRPLWQREVQIEEVRIDGARLNFDPHAIDKIMALGGKETDKPLPLVSLAIDSFAIADSGFKSSGANWGALARNISENVLLKDSNMILHDVDLDKALDEFQKMGAYSFNDLFGLLTL